MGAKFTPVELDDMADGAAIRFELAKVHATHMCRDLHNALVQFLSYDDTLCQPIVPA